MNHLHAGAIEPIRHELLLIGGGHSHVAVIRHFGMNPLPGLRVTVLSRDVHTTYSGMLPGLIAGHYQFDDCHIDLRALCQANGVRLIHGTVIGIDRERQQVLLEDRPALRYDWVSVNIGSRPALHTIPGACEHGIAVKPIDRFLDHWHAVTAELANKPRAYRIAIVGGGAAGIEVALACMHRLRTLLGANSALVSCDLVCAASQLLESHNARVRAFFDTRLGAAGIKVHCAQRVIEAHDDGLQLGDGARIAADLIIWAIHAGAPGWPRDSGIACDQEGFIRVDQSLRSVNEPRLFAAGDIAALPLPVAKSGVYAVRAGMILAGNLRRVVLAKPLRTYRPQLRFLSLLTTGERHAVASRGPLFAAGRWVWRWKNHIDRAFMARYRPQPAAPTPRGEDPEMRCGGCAAKVGSETLGRVLAQMHTLRREGIVHSLASAEDAAVLLPPAGQQLVQSIDYFRTFIDDPYLLGRIAALHCLGDIYAMGARPHSALAIATIPWAAPAVMEQSLHQLMQGALRTLEHEQVTLLGGHSNEGAELGFGLSVNGYAMPQQLLLKSALRSGHALILTKAIGTGTLLAANQAAATEGRWIEQAIANMLLSPRIALEILRTHGVAACTDVTGFGVLGHLLEMLRASEIGAHLRPAAIAVLPGAHQCLARGYRSSLHHGNSVYLDSLTERVEPSPGTDLLLDPQTAGGLLGAVPAEQAERCVAALQAAGYPDAAIIAACDPQISAGRVALC